MTELERTLGLDRKALLERFIEDIEDAPMPSAEDSEAMISWIASNVLIRLLRFKNEIEHTNIDRLIYIRAITLVMCSEIAHQIVSKRGKDSIIEDYKKLVEHISQTLLEEINYECSFGRASPGGE